MPLMNINSDWMSNTSSSLCINLYYLCSYTGSLSCILWLYTIMFMLNYLPLDILKHSPISLDIMGSDIIRIDILGLICVWDPQQVTPSF